MSREEGRIVGIALGVGVLVGALAMLVRFSREASASTLPRGAGRETLPPFAGLPKFSGRFLPLVERWRGEVTKRSKDLPVPAILEWIRSESGGDMCSIGGPSEVGIFQLMFPGDAKYGATLEGLRAICRKSQRQDPADISWMSEGELDMQVGAGIRKILAARDEVRRVFAENRVTWPEMSPDFGSAVKQIHAAPAVITELVPKLSRQGGPPANWQELRRRVMSFPSSQLGSGLLALWNTPSKHGLKNRLEDTLNNAEAVGRAWGASYA